MAMASSLTNGIVECSSESRSSESPSNDSEQGNVGNGKDFSSYLPLYKAALRGDWEEGKKFLGENNEELLNSDSHTPLHVAVQTGISNDFVRNLLETLPQDALARQDSDGDTALHLAALVGNTEAVMLLVNKRPELQYILNTDIHLPVHLAGIQCHTETLKYLIFMSKKDGENSPFVGELGVTLLTCLIASGYVDFALSLVKKYPNMATLKDREDNAPLQMLAEMNSLFPSGDQSLSWWQNWIYSCIPLEPSTSRKINSDIEKSLSIDDRPTKFSWSEVACRVSTCVKRIKDKKVMHRQALELAKFLCERTASLPDSEAGPIFYYSIIKAAELGIHELVEEIIEMFPEAVFTSDENTESNIFLLAARKRLEKVFNLIYQMTDRKHYFFDSTDSSENNFMHMCAKLAPPDKLNLISGAALQMQRELQWFKEMENFVNPSRRMLHNIDGRTAKMLFTEEHKELKVAGEKWMKDTASSCSIAAALITTVVFAAAFNVPGNVNTEGIPILLHKTPFLIFIIADCASLFTSTTSLLMFLSILTSRYAEEDFLYVLPKRLCMGLLTLFTSITFMMISFTVSIYITLQHKSRLLLIPVALLACLPVATFVLLQFPLLMAVLSSTYGPGIFGKKSDCTLH